MKRILLLVLLAGLFTLGGLTAQEMKIGYINSALLLQKYKGATDAQAEFEEKMQVWQKKADDMKAEIERLTANYDKQKDLLNDDKKKEKLVEIKQKEEEYKGYLQEIFGEGGKAASENEKLVAPLVDKINAILVQIGEEENFDFIFDTVNGNVVFAKPEYDLTDRVLEKLEIEDNKENK